MIQKGAHIKPIWAPSYLFEILFVARRRGRLISNPLIYLILGIVSSSLSQTPLKNG